MLLIIGSLPYWLRKYVSDLAQKYPTVFTCALVLALVAMLVLLYVEAGPHKWRQAIKDYKQEGGIGCGGCLAGGCGGIIIGILAGAGVGWIAGEGLGMLVGFAAWLAAMYVIFNLFDKKKDAKKGKGPDSGKDDD